jgi:hypothetical protein
MEGLPAFDVLGAGGHILRPRTKNFIAASMKP